MTIVIWYWFYKTMRACFFRVRTTKKILPERARRKITRENAEIDFYRDISAPWFSNYE